MGDLKKYSMGKIKNSENAMSKTVKINQQSKPKPMMAGNVKGKGNLKVSSGMIQKKR